MQSTCRQSNAEWCYLLFWTSISATRAALMVWACWAARAGESCVDPDPIPNTSFSAPVFMRSRLLVPRMSVLGCLESKWCIHAGASDMAEALVGCAEFMAETTRSSQPGDAGTNSFAATEALPRLVDFATASAGSSEGCMSCAVLQGLQCAVPQGLSQEL